MSHLKFSIITVSFNSAATIEQTLKSVINQNYPFIEYIVIDGASSDNTVDIINQYRDKLALVISEPDRGIYDAMNKGIKLANGDIVGFLNSDDLYAHNHVIAQVANTFEKQTIDACYGDLIYFSENDPANVKRYWQSRKFERGLFAKGFMPPHPTFFAKRELYLKWGGFDLSYPIGNDVELMMRFLEKNHCRSHYLPHVLVNMRLGGVSNRSLKNIFMQNWQIIRAHKNLNLPISVFNFVGQKLFERAGQFIKKPRSLAPHVKL